MFQFVLVVFLLSVGNAGTYDRVDDLFYNRATFDDLAKCEAFVKSDEGKQVFGMGVFLALQRYGEEGVKVVGGCEKADETNTITLNNALRVYPEAVVK